MKRASDVSHVLGTPSKPLANPKDYVDNLESNLSISSLSYLTSYLLVDMGNTLLVGATKEGYAKIKDPLKIKKESLEKGIEKYNNIISSTKVVIESLQDKNLKQKLRDDVVNIITADAEKVQSEVSKLENLQKQRDKLYENYRGLFQAIPRKLTATFINKYEEITEKASSDKEILTFLMEQRSEIKVKKNYKNVSTLCKLFDVEEKLKQNEDPTLPTLRSLEKKMDSLLGEVTDDAIKQYNINNYYLNIKSVSVDINTLEPIQTKHAYKSHSIKKYSASAPKLTRSLVTELKDKLNNGILTHFQEIYEVSAKLMTYTYDPEYLNKVEEQSFLVKVRAYRGLIRDVEKNILLREDEKVQIAISPGDNTMVKIHPTGATSIEVGELGSYKRIASNNLKTLQNYQNFHYSLTNKQPCEALEKENIFMTLFEIEAIRNSSALLTTPMFFELAHQQFKGYYATYQFENIAQQMPMAMKGAVSGSVYIETLLKDYLGIRLPYDYREDGKEENAEKLDNLNQHILFDWLSYKMNINQICQDYNEHIKASKEGDYSDDTSESLELDNVGWSKHRSKNKICLNSEKYEITLKLDQQSKSYCLAKIKAFSMDVFRELITNWYGKDALSKVSDWFFLSKKLIPINLKAAAEPKDPDINRDQDEATAISLKNTEQSDDNFNIDQKVNNKIAEELTKSTQNLNINDLIGEAQAFNNVIDLTLLNTPLELLGFCSELIVM